MAWKIQVTHAPQPRKPYVSMIAWILAGVMVAMLLLHLVRIDTLIPVIAGIVPATAAAWFVTLIVIIELLALPYLLRIKLSPLFRVISGALVVAAPLIWLCFTIWAYGAESSTGQFSSYVQTPGSWWLIVLNMAWLAGSYWLLWLLRFDESVRSLRKRS